MHKPVRFIIGAGLILGALLALYNNDTVVAALIAATAVITLGNLLWETL